MFQPSTALSAHSDVLSALIPEDDVSRAALLEELKRRAKAAVGSGQWPDAARLYEKGIEAATDCHDKAILYSNLSLSQFKMSKLIDALESAHQAVELDATYVKAWWRLGQAQFALNQFDAAVQSMEKAVTLDSDNKALRKEHEKFQKQRDLEAEKKEKEEEPPKTTTTTIFEEVVQKTSTPLKEKKSDESADKIVIDDEAEFSKSDHVKGYKIVNGKKTSFFHNELSEETARLIGDIRPKKLEEVKEEGQETKTNGTSVWNKAGTWEEKDVTKAVTEQLKTCLGQAEYELPDSSPAPHSKISVDKVECKSGHASVARVRGKKRFIYEYDVLVHWVFVDKETIAKGTLHYFDIDGTSDESHEATFNVTESDDPNLRPLLNAFVANGGLRDSIQSKLTDWVRWFHETY